jgi:hypothetical protein
MKDQEKAYAKDKKSIFRYLFLQWQHHGKVIGSVQDFIDGEELNHCIYTNKYFAEKIL